MKKKAFPLEIPLCYRDHFASVYRTSSYYISKLAIDVSSRFSIYDPQFRTKTKL